MNRKFISRSNYVLRKALNQEQNLDIVKDFIEQILEIKISKIILREYLEECSKYLPKEEDFGIISVRIVDDNGKEQNVGIQFIDGYFIQSKILLYYAQIHMLQDRYNTYNTVVKTTTINILDCEYFKTKELYKPITICGNIDKLRDFKNVDLHILEIPKFIKTKNIIKDKKDAWMAYFAGTEDIMIEEAKEKDNKIKKLDDILDKYWQNEIIK